MKDCYVILFDTPQEAFTSAVFSELGEKATRYLIEEEGLSEDAVDELFMNFNYEMEDGTMIWIMDTKFVEE